MIRSEKVRIFVMGFVAAAIVVLDTHTGEVRYTGIGGAGGGKEVGSLEMFAELSK